MINPKELNKEEIDLIKHLQETKDNKTQVEIRLFDYKNSRIAYKTLTVRELMLICATLNIEWHGLEKGDKE